MTISRTGVKVNSLGFIERGRGVILSPVFLFAFIIVLSLLVSLSPIRSFDVWWHLAAGKWMVQHHRIISKEPFSFLHFGREWIDCAWLFQILIYSLYSLGGYPALVLWKFIVILAVLSVLYCMWRAVNVLSSEEIRSKRISSLSLVLSFVFLILYYSDVTLDRLYVRPHLLSYLYIACTLYVLLVFEHKPKLLFTLIPVSIFWVNTHGSFPILIVMIGCFSIGYLACGEFKTFLFLVLVMLLLALCFLINPFSYKVWKLVLAHGESNDALLSIQEWQRFPIWSLLDFRIQPFRKLSFFVAFLSVLFYVIKWRSLSALLLSGSVFILFLKHHRFYPLWILVSFPFVVVSLGYLMERYLSLRFFIFSLSVILTCGLFYKADLSGFSMGVKKGKFPEGVSSFIKKVGVSGRMFNPYGYGGYLIWELFPSVKTFIDGRTPTIYSSDDFYFYRIALKNPRVFERLVDRYHISLALLKRKYKLAQYLLKNDGWDLVAFDHVSMLFVKKDIENRTLKKYSLGNFDIDVSSIMISKLNNAEVLYRKLLELDKIYPECEDYKLYIGICLYAMHKPEEAKHWFKRALTVAINKGVIYYNLGILNLKLGRYEEAALNLRKAINLGERSRNTIFLLAKSYYLTGKYRDAVRVFDEYIKVARLSADKDAYWYSGLALYKLGKYKEALSKFKRFSFLVDEPAAAYYNMGNCYFALGKLEDAVDYYLKAIRLRKKYSDALYNLWKAYQALGNIKEASRYKKIYESLKASKR